jgi:hypothetical protein
MPLPEKKKKSKDRRAGESSRKATFRSKKDQLIDKYSGQAREAWEGSPKTPDELARKFQGQAREAWGGGVDMSPYDPASNEWAPMPTPDGPTAEVSDEQLRQAIQMMMQERSGGRATDKDRALEGIESPAEWEEWQKRRARGGR